MLKKLIPWATAFVGSLVAAVTHAHDHPLPAALWPPHRRGPTQPIHRKGRIDRFRMAVIDGRVTIGEVTKLVGGKGLRA